jgi:dipeptidyl aminopeptidase/acylaminoacyl peptidase
MLGTRFHRTFFVLLLSVGGRVSAGSITIDQLVDIKHPSNPLFSPDGSRVAFLWERAGVANLYAATVDGKEPPRALTQLTVGQPGGVFWAKDSGSLYYSYGGDLWQVPVAPGGESHPVWRTPGIETSITPSPDWSRVAYVRSAESGNEIFVRSLAGGSETRVIGELVGAGGLSWSPDGERIAFTVSRTIRHDESPSYSGAKIVYTITERTPGQTYVVKASGGPATPIGPPGGFGGLRWSDSTHAVFDRTSPDFKRRTIYQADVTSGELKVLHEDMDEKFWSPTGDAGASGQPSPDGKFLAFVSDRDGWDHIYVKPMDGGPAVQITKGNFEAWRPQWSKDSTRIAFDANEPSRPGVRHLGVITLNGDPARASVAMITSGRGTNIAPAWSPDGRRLVYQHTDPQNSADVYVVEASPGATPVRLSDSFPPGVDRSTLVAPELVSYKGPDGKSVPAYLFVPKGLDRKKKHPAIVWIHGDGVNQNYDGWHVQRNYAVYYSYHQYLLQKGYVVIAPDYRGSIGYGRDWRQGVHMDVGGNDAKDASNAADYLKTLPYVDSDRIGVWGLSYGGFFTLIALTDQPKTFRCGVDVAGVVDYVMYYNDPYRGAWTASRIGTPEQNPGVYEKASPLSHVDRLERPLLILHGTSDVNVPYLHSVRLVDELMKKGKGDLVSFMTYPGEFHYFTREHVLKDAWSRVERFFDSNLISATSDPARAKATH